MMEEKEKETVVEAEAPNAEVTETDWEKECQTLQAELQTARENAEAANDKYLRILAEYDNYRKRAAKDRENTFFDAYGDVLKEILPVVDNLERALQFEDGAQLAQGVKMTYTQFQDAMKRLGIEEIETATFDPQVHNAVMHIEDEAYGEGEIVEVFQKGYKKGDRVLRFAMVKVAN